jgi:hypothetical protein
MALGATTLVFADGKKPIQRNAPRRTTPAASASSQAETTPAEPGKGAPLVSIEIGDGGVRTSALNPQPEEFADGGPPTAPPDLDRILGEIAMLRARVAAVSDTLFKSRIVVRLEARGDHAKIGKLTVSLDDGVVYTAPARLELSDETTVYDHAVAPGKHWLGVEVERRDDRGEAFGSAQRSRFAVDVPENQRLATTIRIEDDSDMGSEFASNQKGGYDLRIRLRARAER